jgi:hypothetical protein
LANTYNVRKVDKDIVKELNLCLKFLGAIKGGDMAKNVPTIKKFNTNLNRIQHQKYNLNQIQHQ